jgi:hypothetical protein
MILRRDNLLDECRQLIHLLFLVCRHIKLFYFPTSQKNNLKYERTER